MLNPLTEIIRALDEYFGKDYYTLKDIFIEERRKILQRLLKGKMQRFAQIYQDMYDEGKGSIYHMQNLGLAIPDEFKIAAQYALSRKFNDLIADSAGFMDAGVFQEASDINFETHKMGIKLDKTPSNTIFGKKILQNINRLAYSFEMQQADVILELFDHIEKLELEVDISEAQNIYYAKIYHKIGDIIETAKASNRASDRKFVQMLLDIGIKLNINTEFYRTMLARTNA